MSSSMLLKVAFLTSAFAAILFGREHIDQLGAAQDKGLELLGLLVVQGPHLGLDGGAVVGNDTCIDAIGLSRPVDLAKVSGAPILD